jgi:hypothetical protein
MVGGGFKRGVREGAPSFFWDGLRFKAKRHLFRELT